MKRIGIISDTHGTFDDTLREFLRDVDEIWHAGDIGSLEVSDRIAAFKPLRAVAGNIDDALTRRIYSDFNVFDCEGVRVLMTHIGGYPRRYDPRALARIRSVHPKLFVSGHSHILKVMYDPIYDLLHINPGAAGEYGFHKVRTPCALRSTARRCATWRSASGPGGRKSRPGRENPFPQKAGKIRRSGRRNAPERIPHTVSGCGAKRSGAIHIRPKAFRHALYNTVYKQFNRT